MKRSVSWSIICTALIGVVLAGCASLPPAKATTDLKAIAGSWEGWMTVPNGYRLEVTSTIQGDGSYETNIPALSNPGPRFAGRVTVQDGRYRWKSDTTGRTGTYTLHEGDGRRVLVSRADDGGYAEYTPAK